MLNNTQIAYIKAIQKASKENRLVIFAGAGTSFDAGVPLWSGLVNELSRVLPEEVRHNFEGDNLQLTQLYREVSDDKDYYDGIESVLLQHAKSSNVIHDTILSLNPCHIITTNYDNFIEDAALRNHRQYYVVATDDELPGNHGERLIVKMHGDLNHHNIILTENDYYDYSRKFPLIRSFVLSLFTTKVILFIGFSFNDPNLKFILREIRSELGKDMQHVYLLNDYLLSDIEKSHLFNKGINVLTITGSDLNEEFNRLKILQCSGCNLGEKGRSLVDRLNLIKDYHDGDGLIGLAYAFAKENLEEIRFLGRAWENMFPQNIKGRFHRDGYYVDLPASYGRKMNELFSSRSRIRKAIQQYGHKIDELRDILINDDIFEIGDIYIRSKSYAKRQSKHISHDCVYHYLNLDQVEMVKRIKELRNRKLTYTIDDLELPYILFEAGHFYEAYEIYNRLAPEMWQKKRYALFFICIFNMHSVSLPAYKEKCYIPDINVERICQQYESVNLMEELKQLPLPKGVFQMFSDIVNYKQLSENVIQVTSLLQSIEYQKRGAEQGTLWSYNEYIQSVIWNFITFLDFITANYIILDNNKNGQQYYNAVTQCIINSNLIPSSPNQSKLEKLFRETLFVIVLKTNNSDLKRILKEIGSDKKLTVDDGFKLQLQTYINNIYLSLSPSKQVIEDKVLGPILKNILMICSIIRDCPKLDHLDDILVTYWERFSLQGYTDEITYIFKNNPPTTKTAGKLLSIVANSHLQGTSLTELSQTLVNILSKGGCEWNDTRVGSFIESHHSIDFASIILPVVPSATQKIVKEWLMSHIKSLYEIASAEILSGALLLTPEIFDKYKTTLYTKQDIFGEEYLAIYLALLYRQSKYEYLRPKMEELAKDHLCIKFILDPLHFEDYSKVDPQWFEDLQIEELKSLAKNRVAFSLMKKQAKNSKYGAHFKKRLEEILWEAESMNI